MKRIKEFIKTQNGHKINNLTSVDIKQYFKIPGHQNCLSGWQFYQCIDAIRILYCERLVTLVYQGVDWQYRLDSAKQLDSNHPATARQLTNEELTFIKKRKGRVLRQGF